MVMVASFQYPSRLVFTKWKTKQNHQQLSIGELQTMWAQSKTKADAAHVGLSQQLVPPRQHFQSPQAKHPLLTLNNNLFRARAALATWAAMVVGTSGHGTTCKQTLRYLLLHTHTLQALQELPAHARPTNSHQE